MIKTGSLVEESINAYIKQDVSLAKLVCESDDVADELFFKIIIEFL